MIALREFAGRKAGVLGLGKAGEAAVAALRAGGAEVFAWDDKGPKQNLAHVAHCEPSAWPWAELAFLCLSPGVPLTHPRPHPAVEMARRHGVPVVGEVELLYRACPDAMYIGITGTNGKSTTTSLIAHILRETGYAVEVGGNLGTPALALAPLGKGAIYVLEMSSYQLDLIDTARFDIAVLLNITPDHLDRHGDMGGYVAAKKRIFMNQRARTDGGHAGVDQAIIVIDDDYTRKIADELDSGAIRDVFRISLEHKVAKGAYVQNGILYEDIPGHLAPEHDHDGLPVHDLPALPGRHNWQNAAAAYMAARLCAGYPEAIMVAMRSFPGLRHRLQLVAEIGGVRFINDSKATNADAAMNALAPYDTIYWIAGGKPKAGGIESLASFFPRIAHAFLIGEAEAQFAATLEGRVPYTRVGTLERAVRGAAALAWAEKKPGAVVLLSPACASFDQFTNFEERGDRFCEFVERLDDPGLVLWAGGVP